MKVKTLLVLFTLVLFLTTLSGCYDARGIEELAYVTAFGLDVTEDELLLLTFQISLPSSAGSPDSGSSQSNNTDTISVECGTINSGISLVNSCISKQIDLTQCKVIVFSEELAERGISEYVNTLRNNIEIRPDCNVIISRCMAKDFIENASPSIETLTARYYEVSLKSSEYTGYTTETKFFDFVEDMKSTSIQATAILGGLALLNKTPTETDEMSTPASINFKANETPIKNSDTVETFGTAVFYDDKLVGELTGLETICHLMLTNTLENCDISVPDLSSSQNSIIDLRINQKRNSKIKVDFVNGTPYISVEVFIEGYGLSLDESTNYNTVEGLEKINQSAEQYLKLQLENYLYKTAKELNSDIVGFGNHALSKYLTIDEWSSSGWLENYKNSFFDVTVHVNIKSGSKFNISP